MTEISRNQPCPCGSGQRYKHCCGAVDLFQQAHALHQSGDWARAEPIYRQLLARQPDNPNLHALLGLLLQQRGHGADGLPHLQQAVALAPHMADWWVNLGSARIENNLPHDALVAFQQALQLQPKLAAAWLGLGVTQLALRDFSAAHTALSQAQQLQPDHPGIALNLARWHHERGDPQTAAATYRQLLRRHPDYAAAWFNLGNTLSSTEPAEAIAAYQTACQLEPTHPDYWLNLGNALRAEHQRRAAQAAYDRCLNLAPDHAAAHANLCGLLAEDSDQLQQAIAHGRLATQLAPSLSDGWSNLALAHAHQQDWPQAQAAAQRAIDLQPDSAAMWANLGQIAMQRGAMPEAIAMYRQAFQRHPDISSGSNLLFCQNFIPTPAAELLRDHHAVAALLPSQDASPAKPRSRADNRLRIGYVSADLRNHPVAHFLLPVLQNHARSEFAIHVFANQPATDNDLVTQQLQAWVDGWHDIHHLNDDQARDMIQAQDIDILIDLSGYTAGHRLGIFSRRAAPIQASWLGYLNTTALPAMDWRITDRWVDPQPESPWQTEQLLRLEMPQWPYHPPAEAPAPGDLPALHRGHLTLASLNQFAKVTDELLQAWLAALHQLPATQLWLVADDHTYAEQRLQTAAQGFPDTLKRVRLLQRMAFSDYLQLHQQIDIALDTYPYNGATTTCHALWMGVPVLSVCGNYPPAARSGLSILSAAGLDDWICHDLREVPDRLQYWHHHLSQLAALRRQMRERLRRSPLLDTPRFVRSLEQRLRALCSV